MMKKIIDIICFLVILLTLATMRTLKYNDKFLLRRRQYYCIELIQYRHGNQSPEG